MPSGIEGDLVVTLEPRAEGDYQNMVIEIENRLASGELGSNVAITTDGKLITLTSRISKEDAPTLKTIARYSGEFWLNTRINGMEL